MRYPDPPAGFDGTFDYDRGWRVRVTLDDGTAFVFGVGTYEAGGAAGVVLDAIELGVVADGRVLYPLHRVARFDVFNENRDEG